MTPGELIVGRFCLLIALSMKFPFFSLLGLTLTCAFVAHAARVSIPTVQGAGLESPMINQVVTVEGIVTGDFSGGTKFDGFFIQDRAGDDNPATSDGLFVYVNSRSRFAATKLAIGDLVRITGRVTEYKGQTQLSAPTELKILSHEAHVEPMPLELKADMDWEALEGMLVSFPQTLVVTAQNELPRYGTLKLSPSRLFNPTNERIIEEVQAAPQAPISLTLDDGSGDSYPKQQRYLDGKGTRRTGSTVDGLVGIVSQLDAEYRVQPTREPELVDSNPRPFAPPIVGGSLRVAGANVLNYWTTFQNKENPDARGADNAPQFERQSAKIMAEMKGLDADVLGIMELENNPATVREFERRLNAAYGNDEYLAVTDPPEGLGDDAIRLGLFYKPSKVEPIGKARVATDRIFDRRPFAQTFRDKQTGGVFTVVVNHFKSKGSSPKTGDTDKGEGAWNLKRTQQARLLLAFITQLATDSGDPDVLTFGDFNAYAQEAPIRALRDAGLKHLNLRLPPADRYSFSYDGLFGSLDHALVTPTLDAQVTGFGEWHVNADEPFFNTYDRTKVADFVPDPYRASDHDPFVVGLNLTAN